MFFSGKASPALARVPPRQLEAIRTRRWWDLWLVQCTAPSEARFGTSMRGMSFSQPVKPCCRGGSESWADLLETSSAGALLGLATKLLYWLTAGVLCAYTLNLLLKCWQSAVTLHEDIHVLHWKCNSFCWITELIIIMCVPHTSHRAPTCGLFN